MSRKQLALFLLYCLCGSAMMGQNLLTNASFEDGPNSWQMGSWGGAQGTHSVVTTFSSDSSSSLEVIVTSAAADPVYKRFVRQIALELDSLAEYTFSFDIMSMSGAEEAVGAHVASDMNLGAASWGTMWKNDSLVYQGDGTWHTMSYDITAQAQTGTLDMDSLALFFGFGRDTGTFYLDNIKLEPKQITPPPPASDNFVQNFSFEDGTNLWQIGSWGGAQGVASVVTTTASDSISSLEVDVTASVSDNVFKQFVRQLGFELDSLEVYTLSFDVMSMSGAEESVGIRLASDVNLGSAAWGIVWENDSLAYQGDGAWHTMSYDITAQAQNGTPDMDSLILFFGFGRNTGTFYLDNIVLSLKEEVIPPPADTGLVQNGSFETGITDWQNGSWGGAQAGFTHATMTGSEGTSSVEVTVNASDSNPFKAYVRKYPIALDSTRMYTLTFDVMSNSGNAESIGVNFYSDLNIGSTSWGEVWKNDSIPYQGDGEWHSKEYSFFAVASAGAPDMDSLALMFGFAKNTGTFYLDNVVLLATDSIKPPDTMTVAIQSIAEEIEVALYPNPAQGDIQLDIRLPRLANVEWQMIGVDGREVLAGQVPAGTTRQTVTLPTSQLPAGMYLLRGRAGEALFVQRVILK